MRVLITLLIMLASAVRQIMLPAILVRKADM